MTRASPDAEGVVERTRLGAYAWCEADGEVLMCRVAPGYPDPGSWSLPGGGLEFGEDPAAGALRELDEETGLEGRVEALMGILSEVLEPEETVSGHRIHMVSILYRVTPTGGELRDEPDGSTDRAAWIPLDRLEGLPLVDLVPWARARMGR